MKELKAMNPSEMYIKLKLDRTLKKTLNRVVNTDRQCVYVLNCFLNTKYEGFHIFLKSSYITGRFSNNFIEEPFSHSCMQ